MVCVYVMTIAPKAQPKVVLERLGIDLAIPSLQGKALIHYTDAVIHSLNPQYK